MSHLVFFRVPLNCSHCGNVTDPSADRLFTSSFGQDPGAAILEPGNSIELEVLDFEDGFLTQRRPEDDETSIVALETFGCAHCGRVLAARLEFERLTPTRMRFVGAATVPLTTPILDEANFVSRKLDEYGVYPGDDAARIHELVRALATPTRRPAPTSPDAERVLSDAPITVPRGTDVASVAARVRAPLDVWTETAQPVAQLRAELERAPHSLDVICRIARSVLVNPHQSLAELHGCLRGAIETANSPSERLAAADLMNVLACGGAAIDPSELGAIRAWWLRGVLEVGPPLALRLRVGLAGIVLGAEEVARAVAPPHPDPFFDGEAFPGDVLGLLGYLVTGVRVGATLTSFAFAWQTVVEELSELCHEGQLDETTLLWIARVVYASAGAQPVGRVAAVAHDYLWGLPHKLAALVPEPAAFPIGSTLANGTYRVDRLLRGRGAQQLYLGTHVATGAPVLVGYDDHYANKQSIDELRRVVSYRVPGMFELGFVGTFDVPRGAASECLEATHWVTVEAVPSAGWLPQILGPADPWNAPRKAIDLGRSAGRILMAATQAGVDVSRVRPELMWAERQDGHHRVTGLTTRPVELFLRGRGELRSHPVFDRFYEAPEVDDSPTERSVAYALAVMIAEWATGKYPFASRYAPNGVRTAQHLPIEGPHPLVSLLERTIRYDPNERPRLQDFVAELDRLA